MSNLTADIEYTGSGNAKLDPAGPFNMDQFDTLTATLGTGFDSGDTLQEVSITTLAGAAVGTWNPSEGPKDLGGIFEVSGSTTEVVIEALLAPPEQEKYNLQITGDRSGTPTTWATDPELINNPGT